jgi:tape measure domain-containing protein
MSAMANVGIKLSLDGATQAEANLRRVEQGIKGIGGAAESVRGALGSLAGAFAGVVSVRAFVQAADAVTQLQNQLKLATGSVQSATAAYNQLFEIAQRSRVSFTELGGTFASIARASESLGLSQEQLLKLTETIGNAVTVSGASAQASQAALIQLSQGLASGVLRGEELNSILEQTPRLAQALADGLGVSRGALRALGQEGKLTAETVIGALQSQSAVLAREVQDSVVTVSQAFTQVQNSATRFAGEIDRVTGSSGTLAGSLQAVSQSIDEISGSFRELQTAATGSTSIVNGLSIVFETVAVVGANVAFVLKAIGQEIVLIAQQASAVARLEFAEAGRLGEEGRRQAEKNRKAVDELTDRILRNGQLARQARASLEGVDTRAEDARLARQAGNTTTLARAVTNATASTKALKEAERELAEQRKRDEKIVELRNRAVQEAYEKEQRALVALARAEFDRIEAVERNADSAEAQLQRMLDEERATALAAEQNITLAQAIEEVAIARLREQQAALMREGDRDAEVLAIQREIDARKELAGAIGRKEARQAAADSAKDAAREWERTADNIERTLTDALMRGFESGKDFARVLRDTVVNMFKTMVLRPVVQAIVSPVAGAVSGAMGFSGAANAAQGQLGNSMGLASGIKSVYETVMGGFTSLGNSVAFAAQDMGAWLVNNTTGLLNKAGGSLMQNAGALGTGASYLGGIGAGIGAGRLISGGYSAIGSSGNTAVNAGTVIGAIFGGPFGAALGGAIGGAVNRLFGRKAPELVRSSLRGTFGTDGADVRIVDQTVAKGGVFRSDKWSTSYSPISSELDQFLDTSLRQITAATQAYAKVLGSNADAINGITQTVSIGLKGLNAKQQQEKVLKALGGFGDVLADGALEQIARAELVAINTQNNAAQIAALNARLANLNAGAPAGSSSAWLLTQEMTSRAQREAQQRAQREAEYNDAMATTIRAGITRLTAPTDAEVDAYLSKFLRSGETTGEALSRLANSLLTVNQVFDTLNQTLLQASLTGGDAASKLIDLFGGAEAFAQATSAYYQNFYSEQERIATATRQLTQTFENMGLTLPTTKDAYRDLVESQDLYTESGRQTYAALINLSGVFAEIANASAGAGEQLEVVSERLRSLQQDRAGLERELLVTQGGDVRAFDTVGFSAAELAAYDYNDALRQQIAALRSAQQAAEDAAQAEIDRIRAVAEERAGLENQLLQLQGNTAALREQERSALDETNRAIYDQIIALQDQQEAAQAAAQAEQELQAQRERVAQERSGLELRILQLQGDTSALRELERNALDESNRALFDRIVALEEQSAAEAEAAQQLQALQQQQAQIAQERGGLERQLLQLQGDTATLRQLERSVLDESNRALFDQINALQDSIAANEAAARAEAELQAEREQAAQQAEQERQRIAQERFGLESQLLQLQGNTVALRERERAALDESNRALFDQIAALQDQQTAAQAAAQAESALQAERERVSQERFSLEGRLLQLQGNTAALRERERSALDESNRLLFDQITALEDSIAASEAAARAEAELTAERERAAQEAEEQRQRIAQERSGLELQLLQLQGNTAEIRRREREQLDASNRALYDQIKALEDQQAAAANAAAAADELRRALEAAGSSVSDEVQRLRDLITGGSSENLATLQAQFAISTAQARAGDATALSKLPEISRAIEQAAALTASTALEITRTRGSLADSLTQTLAALGLDVPAFAAGGYHRGGIRLVGENGPELEVTGPSTIINSADTSRLLSGGSTEAVANELRALREENRAQARSIAQMQSRMARVLERWDGDGMPSTRVEA